VLITACSWEGLGAESPRVFAKHGAGLVILAGRRQTALDETIEKSNKKVFCLRETIVH
jgi:NADP-dependent 3-hydroxy acid dehydrogenase YdfG